MLPITTCKRCTLLPGLLLFLKREHDSIRLLPNPLCTRPLRERSFLLLQKKFPSTMTRCTALERCILCDQFQIGWSVILRINCHRDCSDEPLPKSHRLVLLAFPLIPAHQSSAHQPHHEALDSWNPPDIDGDPSSTPSLPVPATRLQIHKTEGAYWREP